MYLLDFHPLADLFIFHRFLRQRNRRRLIIAPSPAYRNFPPPVEPYAPHPGGQPYPSYPGQHLREIPAAYTSQTRSGRRTRAPDIDSSGRRLGDLPAATDHDGELGPKDNLPAYDNVGGPPQYFELVAATQYNASRPIPSHS